MTLYVRKAETPVNIYDMMKEEEEKELLLQTGQDLFFLVITDMFCQKDWHMFCLKMSELFVIKEIRLMFFSDCKLRSEFFPHEENQCDFHFSATVFSTALCITFVIFLSIINIKYF